MLEGENTSFSALESDLIQIRIDRFEKGKCSLLLSVFLVGDLPSPLLLLSSGVNWLWCAAWGSWIWTGGVRSVDWLGICTDSTSGIAAITTFNIEQNTRWEVERDLRWMLILVGVQWCDLARWRTNFCLGLNLVESHATWAQIQTNEEAVLITSLVGHFKSSWQNPITF